VSEEGRKAGDASRDDKQPCVVPYFRGAQPLIHLLRNSALRFLRICAAHLSTFPLIVDSELLAPFRDLPIYPSLRVVGWQVGGSLLPGIGLLTVVDRGCRHDLSPSLG
jgi:hypothetical protein